MGIMGESDSLLGDLEDDLPRLQVRRRGRDHGHESCDAVGERGLVVATGASQMCRTGEAGWVPSAREPLPRPAFSAAGET